MKDSGIYRQLSIAICDIESARSEFTVWQRVREFAAGLNCSHFFVVDNAKLTEGLTAALVFGDSPPDVCSQIDRERLNVEHPFEVYARQSNVPFLVSDVRRDERFRGQRWEELMSETLLRGDALVAPVRRNGTLAGAAFFGGNPIKDTPVGRSALLVISHAAFDRIATPMGADGQPQMPALTSRELECIQGLARGHQDEEIAVQLGISRRTVRFHVDHAKVKFGVSSRVHAVAAAVTRGLVTL